METCMRCGREGHSADECKQPLPDLVRCTFLAIVLVLAGCATGPEVITDAKDCDMLGGCVVIGRKAVVHLMGQAWDKGAEAGFDAGRDASCRRDGT